MSVVSFAEAAANLPDERRHCTLCGDEIPRSAPPRYTRCEFCGNRIIESGEAQLCYQSQARAVKSAKLARLALKRKMTAKEFYRMTDAERREFEAAAHVHEASEATWVGATALLTEVLIRPRRLK